MTVRALALTTLLAVLGNLTSCSSIDIEIDFDEKYDFQTLKTFGWLPRPQKAGAPYRENTFFADRLRACVDATLKRKGYALMDPPKGADFQIAFHAEVEEKTQITDWGYSTAWYGGRRRAAVGFQRDISVRQYNQGTLLIDFVDPKTNSLIWRGIARTNLGSSDRLDKEDLQELVDELLQTFPPEPRRP